MVLEKNFQNFFFDNDEIPENADLDEYFANYLNICIFAILQECNFIQQ